MDKAKVSVLLLVCFEFVLASYSLYFIPILFFFFFIILSFCLSVDIPHSLKSSFIILSCFVMFCGKV